MTSKEWTPLEKPYEIVEAPMWFHLRGLSETASGYGSKLNSGRMVKLPDGRSRRMYITCYSNVGTAWIILGGDRRIIE